MYIVQCTKITLERDTGCRNYKILNADVLTFVNISVFREGR